MNPPDYIYCKIAPKDISLFRFLLEGRENLAQFTVLEKKTALIKIFFAHESYDEVQKVLDEISEEIHLIRECY